MKVELSVSKKYIENNELFKTSGALQEHIRNYAKRCLKLQEESLMNELLENVKPPIKGDITRGKLKWRGIYLVVKNDFVGTEMKQLTAIFQRGKRITRWTYIATPEIK